MTFSPSPRVSRLSLAFSLFAAMAVAGCSKPECSDDDDCEGNDWCSKGGSCKQRGTSPGYDCEKDYHCALGLFCADGTCHYEPTNYTPPKPKDAGVDAKAPPEPLVMPFRPSNVGDLVEGRMIGPDSDIVVGMDSDCKPCACDQIIQVSLTAGKTGCFKGSTRAAELDIEMMTFKQTGAADLPSLNVVFLKNLVIGPELKDPLRVVNGVAAGGVVIVVQDKIEISSRGAWAVPGYEGFEGGITRPLGTSQYGKGPGGGGYGESMNGVGSGTGEGGAHCTLGRLGNLQTTPHGKTYGASSLVPLWPGSGGGIQDTAFRDASGGRGGPALQLVAGTSIVLAAGSSLRALGHDAPNPGTSAGSQIPGGGGGSGGSLLLEAPTIEIQGELTALGGAGAGDVKGGQGGDGRIRFNTGPDGLTIAPGAMIKPAYPGMCATLGTLTLMP